MVNNQALRRRANRWITRPTARVSAVIAGAAAIVLLASISTSANAAEDATRISHACAEVMGLDPSELPYDDCIRSLGRTLSQLKRSELTASNRGQCAQQGLDPGTPDFDTCVVKAELFPSGSGGDGAVAPVP